MSVQTLARILCAASRLLKRPVRASELYDLSEEVAVPDTARPATPIASKQTRRKYDSALDRLLLEHGILPARLARRARLTRQTLRRIRANLQLPSVSTVSAIIGALRGLGVNVKARDLWDEERIRLVSLGSS